MLTLHSDRLLTAAVFTAVSLSAACTGMIGASPEGGSAIGSAGGDGASDGAGAAGGSGVLGGNGATGGNAVACKPGSVGAEQMLRLTRTWYNNTVRDLLGDTTGPANAMPGDKLVAGSGFAANTDSVDLTYAEGYQAAAESLAAKAVENLPSILPCDLAVAGESACADSFISVFGRRAFRRPLTTAEKTNVRTKLYNAGGTFKDGIRLVIQGMLQSPYFLYRLELGTTDANAGGAMRLSGDEMASRLSYFLWNTMPDTDLFKAADAGQLATPDGVATQARRLLSSPQAKAAIVELNTTWLEMNSGLTALSTLTKDVKVYSTFAARPDGTVPLRDSMRIETESFVDYVIRTGDGTLTTLMGSDKPWTFADAQLANVYGVDLVKDRVALSPEPSLPAGFVPVALDASKRSGLLTQASVLATHAHPDGTSPVYRGRLLRKRMFCQEPPPPPPNVPAFPAVSASSTVREQAAAHRANPFCAACHELMDPLGLGLEQYDGIGRFSNQDGFGHTVDAQGEITGTDVDGTFVGAVELSKQLLASDEVRGCVARQWFRYALSRVEATEDQCNLDDLSAKLKGNDSVRELIVALVGSDAFRYHIGQ